jgi:hypothetical protein
MDESQQGKWMWIGFITAVTIVAYWINGFPGVLIGYALVALLWVMLLVIGIKKNRRL